MGILQQGYIKEQLDKEYTFTYDGELLSLVPTDSDSISPFDRFKNINQHIKILNGVTLAPRYISFMECNLFRSNSGYVAKPAGYILFNGQDTEFDIIVFKGTAIDFFYRPNQIVEESSEYPMDNKEDRGKLILKPFSDTLKRVKFNIGNIDITMEICISRPPLPIYYETPDWNLGKPESYIKLILNKKITVKEFIDIYLNAQRFFSFLNFQKNVYIEKIEVENRTALGDMINGKVYLPNRRGSVVKDPDKTIGYYYVKDILPELIELISTSTLNLNFLPKDEKDSKWLDPIKYTSCCSSFESIFNLIFPDARLKSDDNFRKAKEDILTYIDKRINDKTINSKIRDSYKSLKNSVELTDYSLERKFKKCLKEYDDILKDYCEKQYKLFELTEEEAVILSSEFSRMRNILVHDHIETFENIHVVAFLIARYMIYIMVFDKCGMPKNQIKQAIDHII